MNLKAGFPYPLIKSGLVHEYPGLEKDLKTDVVIMGGGISGALTAWHLVNAGFDCIVADARSIGLGSTCASTSLLQYEIDTALHQLIGRIGLQKAERSYQLCAESIHKLAAIARQIGFDSMDQRESLYYAAFKKDVPFLKKEHAARRMAGLSCRYLNGSEVMPATGLQAPAALISHPAAITDAYMLTHALHADSIKKGLKVFDRTRIEKIKHTTRSVEMITQHGKKIRAGKLVYATGYEVAEFISKQLVKLKSTYAIISEPISGKKPFWKKDRLIWNTADPYLYMRSMDNRIIIGGRDEDFYTPIRRDKLIKAKTISLKKDFNNLLPDIAFTPEFSWTGTFGTTVDGLPFIGPYKKLPNSYFALGFGGNGITFSVIAAEMITRHLQGRTTKDESIFSFDRI